MWRSARYFQDKRFAAGGPHEAQQIRRGDRACRLVGQRMGVDGVVPQQRLVEDEPNAAGSVVEQAEGGDRPRRHAKMLQERLRLAEGDPARGADQLMNLLEINFGVFIGGDQEEIVLLVLEEEVLGVAPGDLAAQGLRVGNGEERRVRYRRDGDAELVEKCKQVGR